MDRTGILSTIVDADFYESFDYYQPKEEELLDVVRRCFPLTGNTQETVFGLEQTRLTRKAKSCLSRVGRYIFLHPSPTQKISSKR